MKLLRLLLQKDSRIVRTESTFQMEQEQLKKIGKEQFEKLMDRGLDVPVALL